MSCHITPYLIASYWSTSDHTKVCYRVQCIEHSILRTSIDSTSDSTSCITDDCNTPTNSWLIFLIYVSLKCLLYIVRSSLYLLHFFINFLFFLCLHSTSSHSFSSFALFYFFSIPFVYFTWLSDTIFSSLILSYCFAQLHRHAV